MKKYPKYKNTNIEWLDQIPEHWEETRLRNLGFLYGGLSGKSSKDFNNQKNPNAKFYIPFMNIANNFKINTTFLDRVNISENEIQNEVRKGDLFFLMSSENYDDVGKTAVLHNAYNLNNYYKQYSSLTLYILYVLHIDHYL